MKKLRMLPVLVALVVGSAFALPDLQLDVAGGTYDFGTETIIAPAGSNTFEVIALWKTDLVFAEPLTLSVAVLGLTEDPATLGWFRLNGSTYNVTADLTHGMPVGLEPHSVFPTWYREFEVTDIDGVVPGYNTQDRAISGMYSSDEPGRMLNMSTFAVDVGGLAAGTELHFDLYAGVYKASGSVKYIKAPYSHDAESNPPVSVPEPTTLSLLGMGLLSLIGVLRRRLR